jgi:hypothetical protein
MASKKINILTFLKFGNEQNILDLYENGTIYCAPRDIFSKMEDKYRGDKWEAIDYVKTFRHGEIKDFSIYQHDQKVASLQPSFLQATRKKTDLTGNLYCLYAIQHEDIPSNNVFRINPLQMQFGSHVLIVEKNQTFIDRIINAIQSNGYKAQYDVVNYIDEKSYTGYYSPFHKPMSYSYQKEFRIVIHNDKPEALKFSIGSLRNIAVVMETRHFEKSHFKLI